MATQNPIAGQKQLTPPQTFEEFIIFCNRPTPERFIKTREGFTDRGGRVHMVEYVEWHFVADLLDYAWPTWQHGIGEIKIAADGTVYVTAWIDIGGVKREGVGATESKGDRAGALEMAIKTAESDALKRAATKFGIARDLYKKDGPAPAQPRGAQGAVARSTTPAAPRTIARTTAPTGTPLRTAQPQPPAARPAAQMGNTQGPSNPNAPISAKQLNLIRAKAGELGLLVDVVASSYFDVTGPEDLTMGQASSLIDLLLKDPVSLQEAVIERGGAAAEVEPF